MFQNISYIIKHRINISYVASQIIITDHGSTSQLFHHNIMITMSPLLSRPLCQFILLYQNNYPTKNSPPSPHDWAITSQFVWPIPWHVHMPIWGEQECIAPCSNQNWLVQCGQIQSPFHIMRPWPRMRDWDITYIAL